MLDDLIQRLIGRHLSPGDVATSIDLGNIILILIAVFTVTVAAVTAIVILHQTHANKEIARRSFSWNLYIEYLKLSLEYPELAIGIYNETDPVSEGKYDTFVSIMLYAIEEILQVSSRSDRKSWSSSFRYQTSFHAYYLKKILHKTLPKDDDNNYRSLYARNMLKVIDDMFDEKEAADEEIEKPKWTEAPRGELLKFFDKHVDEMGELNSTLTEIVKLLKEGDHTKRQI
jgi:hypothetical protein